MKINIFSGRNVTFYLVLFLVALITNSSNCGGDDVKINYEYGFFPDTVFNLEGMNSEYDDYNMALPQLFFDLPIMFSSNRASEGLNFDFVTGYIHYSFNQVDGSFVLSSEMYDAPFFDYLEEEVNSVRDELGPLRFFNSRNGYEYLFYSSDYNNDNLELKFVEYYPSGATVTPYENVKGDISVLNSDSDDAYITIDWDIEKAYICSDRSGDFDIFETDIPSTDFRDWLESSPATMSTTANVNSEYDDKCPYVMDTIMVFTSNRPGGLGGFDLYYSVLSNDVWSSPINMGPGINSEGDEYRPLIGFSNGFSNNFILFSSNREGGLGGFDLYFAGLNL